MKYIKLKKTINKILWILTEQIGIDLIKIFLFVPNALRYIYDLKKFKGLDGRSALHLKPCLHDWHQEAGITKSEYFWQDLMVARWIHEDNPQKHVDIGSRIDGFVAHVASFRELEVFDVRPITTEIPGVKFQQADLMDVTSLPTSSLGGYCDSLSCLHALEHFGLGRYGDKINPQGFRLGLENMAFLVKPDGVLYLSTPIGKDRIEFNANWVFHPQTILNIARSSGLILHSLVTISTTGLIKEWPNNNTSIDEIGAQDYSLGIFRFIKSHPTD